VLDQLLHASHVLSVKGRSYRLRELEQTLHAVPQVEESSRPETAEVTV